MKLKRWFRVGFFIFFSAFFCSSAFSQVKPGSLNITGFGGGYFFDSKESLHSDYIYGSGFGMNFTDRWGAECIFNYSRFEYENVMVDDKAETYIFQLDGFYHFMPDKRVVPYLAAGVGGMIFDVEETDDESSTFFNYGGGVKFYLTDHLVLRGDVRRIFTFDDMHYNWSMLLGVSFEFGGRDRQSGEYDVISAEEYSKQSQKTTTPEPEVEYKYFPQTPKSEKEYEYLLENEAEPNPIIEEDLSEALVAGSESESTTEEKPVSLELKIDFEFDKAKIQPAYHDTIKKVADYMNEHPDTSAMIEGHTCNIGSDEYNLILSYKRAENMKSYLVDNFHIDPSRLSAAYRGETNPLADNQTETGRQENRCVVTFVMHKSQLPDVKTDIQSIGVEPASVDESESAEEPFMVLDKPAPLKTASSKEIRKLRNIRMEQTDDITQFVFDAGNGPIHKFKTFYLNDPPRLVVDFLGEWEYAGNSVLYIDNTVVEKMRVGEHPSYLRIVMDLLTSEMLEPVFVENDQGLILKLQ